jgi:hypothetical protein
MIMIDEISCVTIRCLFIKDALKRQKVLQDDIQDLEDWIADKEREAPPDDGPIFYQEQLRERLEQYQVG